MSSKMSKMNHSDPKLAHIVELAKQCHSQNDSHSNIFATDGIGNFTNESCPRVFDGLSCWDTTPGGATAYQRCPDFVDGFDPQRYAFKKCNEDGVWFRHPESAKLWSNYTTCINMKDLEFRQDVNKVFVGGYVISLVALIISLAMFTFFRSLHCTRIRIHMHLFTAFMMNNILWVIWYQTVVNTASVLDKNPAWCQAIHIISNYFMVASYLWMFCEGLHLHLSLVVVFVREHVAMRWFNTIGWGVSFTIVAAYAVVRYYFGETERCWMELGQYFAIIMYPVVLSLTASLVFLINVVRVLLTKLHPPHQNATTGIKKAARATLILIPLFGLHFILMPVRPSPDTSGEKVYQVISALVTSLQGLCLSVLFCFTNHDVIMAARSYWSRLWRANEDFHMTGVTAGESVLNNTRENVV